MRGAGRNPSSLGRMMGFALPNPSYSVAPGDEIQSVFCSPLLLLAQRLGPRVPLEFGQHLELVLGSFANGPDHNAARLSRGMHVARMYGPNQFHCLAVDLAVDDLVDAGAAHEHPCLCLVDHRVRLDECRLQDDKAIDALRHAIKEYVDWMANRARVRLGNHQSKESRCRGKRAELRAENDHRSEEHTSD